jgi:hypothetical protein
MNKPEAALVNTASEHARIALLLVNWILLFSLFFMVILLNWQRHAPVKGESKSVSYYNS